MRVRRRLFLNGESNRIAGRSPPRRAMSRSPLSPDLVFRNSGCEAGPKPKQGGRGRRCCCYAAAGPTEPANSRRGRTSTTPARRARERSCAGGHSTLRLLLVKARRRPTLQSGRVWWCPPLRHRRGVSVVGCPEDCSLRAVQLRSPLLRSRYVGCRGSADNEQLDVFCSCIRRPAVCDAWLGV